LFVLEVEAEEEGVRKTGGEHKEKWSAWRVKEKKTRVGEFGGLVYIYRRREVGYTFFVCSSESVPQIERRPMEFERTAERS